MLTPEYKQESGVGLARMKAVGGRVSATRTGEQSVIALFWNSGEGEGAVAMLKTLAEAQKATPPEFARMLSLMDMADLDSRIVYVGLKTKYRHWRPYNALRGAIGGCNLQVLMAAFRGDGKAPLVWVNTALSMTRSWPTPEAMGQELANARVWSGVHFRKSVDVGYRLGQKVAEAILATQLRPLP